MKKRLLLLLIGALSLLPLYAYDFMVNDIWYAITSDNTCAISCIEEKHSGDIAVPFSVKHDGKEYSVTSIYDYAFYCCRGVTSVSIPKSVTEIGEYAFADCDGLKAVYISDLEAWCNISFMNEESNPLSYAKHLFLNGEEIKDLIIPTSIKEIGYYAFFHCSELTSITIPNSVTSIGDYAFYGCSNLKSLTLGSGLLSIGKNVFGYPSAITKVFWLSNTPPDNYKSVNGMIHYVASDQYNFSRQVKYPYLSSKFTIDGTTYVPVSPSDRTCDVIDCDYSFENENLTITDKVINRGVEMTVLNINDYSFYYNPTISTLEISNKGNIGADAFTYCNKLESVDIKNTGNIGAFAFQYCQAIKTADIHNEGNIGSSAFLNCTGLTSAVIDNKGEIGASSFHGCSNLNNVMLGNSVTAIGSNAFANCTSLQTISIPDKVESIGDNIFENCSSLESVQIGKGLRSISGSTFYNCGALSSLIVPKNINNIGNYALSGCKSLSKIIIEADDSYDNDRRITFEDWTSTNHSDNSSSYKEYTFNVIAGGNLSFDYFVDSESGYDFLSVQINGVEILKESGNKSARFNYTFEESGAITLTISYTKDGSNNTGNDLASLQNITVNGNIGLRLGSNGSDPLFADCPLDEVYIGRNLSYNSSANCGYSPFYHNNSLKSIEISDDETKIYDNEFSGCSQLNSVIIGNGVKSIGDKAFSNCTSLEYFSVGNQLESIGTEAFSDCRSLTNFYTYAAEPPVCSAQALDGINKWECTLYVPAECSEKYKTASQWESFFFINETDAVLAESIQFNVESIEGKTGDTFQLIAEVLPENATRKSVVWSTSDPAVVTVDEEGLVTFIGAGEAAITAQTIDGSGVEASINAKVTIKEPELGDSNGNGTVNIADAVNTANYAIGNEVEHFNETAADVNKDGVITLADASATVALILEQPIEESSAAKVRSLGKTDAERDVLMIEDFAAKAGETISIPVYLSNHNNYTALQADLTLPEGLILQEITLGNRADAHSLISKQIDARTTRIVLFNAGNTEFANNNDALLQLTVKVESLMSGRIEMTRIIGADRQAKEYLLTSTGSNNNGMSGIEGITDDNISIETSAGAIKIHNAEGATIAIYAVDGTMISRFEAKSAQEICNVVPGVYIVATGNKIEKVVVK